MTQFEGGPTQTDSSKKIAAGVCGILLGYLGIHKFILGYTTAGVIMLVLSLALGWITCGLAPGAMWLVGLIEGIIYLTKSDADFHRIYVANKREWF